MIEKVALADVSVHLIVISAALEPSTLVSHSSLITFISILSLGLKITGLVYGLFSFFYAFNTSFISGSIKYAFSFFWTIGFFHCPFYVLALFS